ncbi:hypothetical protein SNEBB_006351 [Seison nebaliae]|nr:hypothetical protein SNEBB_006351 [Seison nebaliae]
MRQQYDLEDYRKNYPNLVEEQHHQQNFLFYSNVIPSKPNGAKIEEILNKWKDNMKLLERHHGYIQWIFPLREPGLNSEAEPLQLHEIRKMKSRTDIRERIYRSYEMMLNFYGLNLVDNTGTVERTGNFKERYKNLNRNLHNTLRITRILKSLGEFNFEHLKLPFITFMIDESLNNNQFNRFVIDSLENYWIGTLRIEKERYSAEEKYRKLYEKYHKDDDTYDESPFFILLN